MSGGGGARVHSCAICAKSFTARYLLSRHQSTHSRQRNFLCSFCGKAFLQSSALTVHCASHRPPSQSPSLRRLYDCDVCAKQFQRSSVRNIHRASHEQKMHICSYCGKAFHQKSTLKTHELIHTNSKPFLCNYCDQTFRQNSNLKVHISKQHHNVIASEKPEITAGAESRGSCMWDDSTNAGKESKNVQLENTFSQKKKKSKRSCLIIDQPCENIDHPKVDENEREHSTRKTLKRKFSQEPIQNSSVTTVNAVKTGDVAISNSKNLKFARKIKPNHIYTSTTTDRSLSDNGCLQTVELQSLRASHKSITLEAEPLNAPDALNDSRVDLPLDTEDTTSDSDNSVKSACSKLYFTDGAVEESDGNCHSQFAEGQEVADDDDVLVAQCSERPRLISQNTTHHCDTSALTTNPSIRGQMKIPDGNENVHTNSGIEGVVPVSGRFANDSLEFIAELNDRADVATRNTLESALRQMSDQRQHSLSAGQTAREENSIDTSTDNNLSVVENILANVYRSSSQTGAIIRQSDCLVYQDTIKSDVEEAKYAKKCLSVRSRSNVGTRNHGPKNSRPKKLLYVHLITPAKQVKHFIWNCSINKDRC